VSETYVYAVLSIALLAPCPKSSLAGQDLSTPLAGQVHVIRWFEVAAAVGGVALLSTLDEPVQRFTQHHRSPGLDGVADVFRVEGEPPYYLGVGVGVLALGLATGEGEIQRAGGRVMASVFLSGLASLTLKEVMGRSRPNERTGAYQLHPFTSRKDSLGLEARGAMPSGHTTAAFAVATSLADDIDNPIADVMLYTFATGTAWSRINDNRHWLSDTVAGALLGIASAKLISGRWQIFDLRPPGFLVTESGAAGLIWHLTF
jgi:membrane-associated phospholipid phosphatase